MGALGETAYADCRTQAWNIKHTQLYRLERMQHLQMYWSPAIENQQSVSTRTVGQNIGHEGYHPSPHVYM